MLSKNEIIQSLTAIYQKLEMLDDNLRDIRLAVFTLQIAMELDSKNEE